MFVMIANVSKHAEVRDPRRAIVRRMRDDRDREANPTTVTSSSRDAAPATVAACHPDLVCPVCSARGKTVRMQPVKAHYQCPDCRYFDSCCM